MFRVILAFSIAFVLLIFVIGLGQLTYINTQEEAHTAEHSRQTIALYHRIDVSLRSAEIYTPTYENSEAAPLYRFYKNDMNRLLPDLDSLDAKTQGDTAKSAIVQEIRVRLIPIMDVLRQKNMVEIIKSDGFDKLKDLEIIHRLIRRGMDLEEITLGARNRLLSNANSRNNTFTVLLSILALLIVLTTFFSQFSLRKKSLWLEGFLESVLNTSQNGILYSRAIRQKNTITDFKLIYANRASTDLLGDDGLSLIGKEWSKIPAFRNTALFETCKKVLDTGEGTEMEHVEHLPTGERSFVLSFAKMKDGVTVSFYENTQIKRTAQELKKNIAALEVTNKELEEYAYAASHDLQEPLRKIRTFGSFLLEKQHNRLDEQGREQLNKILQATERMSMLIKDLLTFSGLKTREEEFEPTDLNEIFENVLQDLEMMISQKQAVITHETLPEVDAIPIQMNQLFYNLVNNSLKFAKADLPLHLDVRCKAVHGRDISDVPGLLPDADYFEIIFSDNGIGFNQDYARQIFGLFKRLHDKNQYAGSGIGLALCQKVVANHQGVIAANGKVGVGAQFYIYLPARQPFTPLLSPDNS